MKNNQNIIGLVLTVSSIVTSLIVTGRGDVIWGMVWMSVALMWGLYTVGIVAEMKLTEEIEADRIRLTEMKRKLDRIQKQLEEHNK